MADLDLYLAASTRDNTRQSYEAAVRHFEVEWGGFLPASADSVARYLAHYGAILSISTLRQRLAALAAWHQEHGFADPTKNPIVRKVLRGVQELHPAEQKRATSLQIEQLAQVDSGLADAIASARAAGERPAALRHLRDRALFLLGFWRGFRSDELSRLHVEHIRVVPGEGMECYLPRTKTDRHLKGQTFRAPQLTRMCPVSAYLDWVQAADLHNGPVFRRVDRWGNLGDDALNVDSLLPLLRRVLQASGVDAARLYSTHSLRRGFASWATANGWDLQTLMEHVGWKSPQSAMRYIDRNDPFNQLRIEQSLQQSR